MRIKKILPAIVLFGILAVLIVPGLVSAAGDNPQECCKMKRPVTIDTVTAGAGVVVGSTAGVGNCDIPGGVTVVDTKWGIFCLMNTINTIVDWIFAFLVIFAAFYVIMGAFNILTSSGSPEKVTSGRNYILYAAVGLLVAFIARAIPSLVKAIMGY